MYLNQHAILLTFFISDLQAGSEPGLQPDPQEGVQAGAPRRVQAGSKVSFFVIFMAELVRKYGLQAGFKFTRNLSIKVSYTSGRNVSLSHGRSARR